MSDPRNHLSVDVERGILPRQMTRRRGQVVDLRQTDRKELPARVTISFIAPLGLGSSRERPQKVPAGQEGPAVVAIVADRRRRRRRRRRCRRRLRSRPSPRRQTMILFILDYSLLLFRYSVSRAEERLRR